MNRTVGGGVLVFLDGGTDTLPDRAAGGVALFGVDVATLRRALRSHARDKHGAVTRDTPS